MKYKENNIKNYTEEELKEKFEKRQMNFMMNYRVSNNGIVEESYATSMSYYRKNFNNGLYC